MAWTTPRTWTTGELVTAAHMNTDIRDNINFFASWESAMVDQSITGFTNTAYADLDALTAAPFATPCIVTVDTGTAALVIVSARVISINTSGACVISYRVSGATTVASNDLRGIRTDDVQDFSCTWIWNHTGLTAGTNTFELQARVSANSGVLNQPALTVIPQA